LKQSLRILADTFLWLNIIMTAIVSGGSIYETMVINSVWYSDLPGSLAFMTNPEYSVQPGRFWRSLGGIPTFASLLSFIFNLFVPSRRWLTSLSFVCAVIIAISTIFYFVPILRIIFAPDGGGYSGEELTRIATNWKNGTWIRMLLLLVSLVASVVAVGRSSKPSLGTEPRIDLN
jgi:hypothetical protein